MTKTNMCVSKTHIPPYGARKKGKKATILPSLGESPPKFPKI